MNRQRQLASEDEYYARIEPAIASLDVVGEKEDFLLSFDPLVMQIYGSPRTKVLGLHALDDELLVQSLRGQRILYVRQEIYTDKMN